MYQLKFNLLNIDISVSRSHHKCDEYGCKLLIVTEEYTSQCCGHCGKLSKKFNKRIKTCTYCDTICHRDINGARNIFLKYATKYRIS